MAVVSIFHNKSPRGLFAVVNEVHLNIYLGEWGEYGYLPGNGVVNLNVYLAFGKFGFCFKTC